MPILHHKIKRTADETKSEKRRNGAKSEETDERRYFCQRKRGEKSGTSFSLVPKFMGRGEEVISPESSVGQVMKRKVEGRGRPRREKETS